MQLLVVFSCLSSDVFLSSQLDDIPGDIGSEQGHMDNVTN
jgi:hypothetical protein